MKLYLTDCHWIEAIPKPEEAFGDLAAAVTAFLGNRTQRIDDSRQVFSVPPDQKTQYEFDGTFFTKEQILKIAKFLPWLSFFIPIHINVFFIIGLVAQTNILKHPTSWTESIMIGFLVLSGIFTYLVVPSILFIRSRLLQKSNRVLTIVLVPFMFFISFLCLSSIFLFYEIQRLRAILRAAGLETSFWGVSKSEITKFANGSLPPKPVFPAQSSPKTQYEFDGTFFAKEQILKIAKFLPWLSFFIPIHINVFVIMLLIGKANVLDALPSSWPLMIMVAFASLIALIIYTVLPSMFYIRSRLLQKSNLTLTIVFLPFVFLSSFLCLCNICLFCEIQRLRAILHAAGLETSFWGASKSEITKFANSSLP